MRYDPKDFGAEKTNAACLSIVGGLTSSSVPADINLLFALVSLFRLNTIAADIDPDDLYRRISECLAEFERTEKVVTHAQNIPRPN